MKGKVRWGVIGSGGIARRRTIPEGILMASNAELVGVYGRDVKRNQEVADQFGVQAAASVEELLRMDVNAIYIGSPVRPHLEQVKACAAAGKHVLCEKPLGRDVSQAEQMVAACKAAKVLFGVGLMMRFHSQHRAAAKMVADGALGKPAYGRAQLSCWYPPIAGAFRQLPEEGGGGSIMDLGSHCLDLLEMCFGRIAKLSCFINNTVHNYASEDSATILLSFANGALGTVDVFFCIPDESSKNVLELYGSKGSILASGTIGQGSVGAMTAYLQPDSSAYNAQQIRVEDKGMAIAPEPINTYRAEIEAFSDTILNGAPNPISGEDGLRNQRIMAACYESAKSGKAISLTF